MSVNSYLVAFALNAGTTFEGEINMKILVENNGYKLAYTPDKVNRFHVYKNCKVSPSGELSYELTTYSIVS